jgi:hypothetical protein
MTMNNSQQTTTPSSTTNPVYPTKYKDTTKNNKKMKTSDEIFKW